MGERKFKFNEFEYEVLHAGEQYSFENMKPNFRKKNKKKSKYCNLCHKKFQPSNKFERFCARCKEEDELYLSYE
jgi:protein-arginine kinase activator protein McsA